MQAFIRYPIALGLVFAFTVSARSEVTDEEIREALKQGMEHLKGLQQPDGSWKDPAAKVDHYVVGRTALAALAAARSYTPKAQPSVHKGITYVVQQWPQPKTFSAGSALQLLWIVGGKRYARHILVYGEMVVLSQKKVGAQAGAWSPELLPRPKVGGGNVAAPPLPDGDALHTHHAVMGLRAAARGGFQTPKITWEHLGRYYTMNQNPDGSWDPPKNVDPQLQALLGGKPSKAAATFAGAAALVVAADAIHRNQDAPLPQDRTLDAALKWIGKNIKENHTPYEWYLLAQLGRVTKRRTFGGKDWYQLGAKSIIPRLKAGKGMSAPELAYGMLFLSARLEPVIINKLVHPGGGMFRNDVKNVTEYISERFSYAKEWGVVTTDTPVEVLLKVPILHIGGTKALAFDEAMKQKLKAYVDRGGTIFAANHAEDDAFDKSVRALVAALWPERKLLILPEDHALFHAARRIKKPRPTVYAMTIPTERSRLGVIYLPDREISRRLHRTDGRRIEPPLDLGANIHFYVYRKNKRLERDRKEGK